MNMKSIIRWPGLVAFVFIVSLVATISLVLLDFWIKIAFEKSLEAATGAEVNVSSVAHTFSPFGLTLYNVQLTDPDNPGSNQVQAQQIKANIELAPLLLRKVIIDNLAITGVEFATPRAFEGKVYRQKRDLTELGSRFFPDPASLPSIDEILATSPLKTTQAMEEVEAVYSRHKDRLAQQYETLPSKDKLAAYKQQVAELKATDTKDPAALLGAGEKLKALKQAIQTDKQAFLAFKQAVVEAKSELSPKLAQLKAAPAQDYTQLKALLAGDANAIEDVTTLIFGEKAGQWSRYALAAFDLVAPMLEKKRQEAEEQQEQGRWISFADDSGLPKLWIQSAEISLRWQQEDVLSLWQDITYEHDIIGRATVFKIDSNASRLWQFFKLNGDFWVHASGVDAQQKWQLAGLKLNDIHLLNQEKLDATLQSGLLSSNGNVKVAANQVSGDGVLNLAQLSMQATGSNKVTNIIAKTLGQLTQLKLDSKVSGVVGDLDLSFSSDLNKQLGSALISNIGTDQQGKLDELKAKLDAQTQRLLGDQESQLSEWLHWENLVDGNVSGLDALLNEKLNSVVDDKKDALTDKLKDKLKGKVLGS
jgi:uncharacterized protein (TIGR03545 family)